MYLWLQTYAGILGFHSLILQGGMKLLKRGGVSKTKDADYLRYGFCLASFYPQKKGSPCGPLHLGRHNEISMVYLEGCLP